LKQSNTLSFYIGRLFSKWFLIIFFVFSLIVVLFDYIELLRKARNRPELDIGLITKMVMMHLPNTIQQLVPFVVLFSSMVVLWQLSRSSELTVSRAAGFSIWQVITPFVGVVMVYILLDFLILNPLGALMMKRFEQLDREYFHGQKSIFALSNTGLWLKQQEGNEDYIIRIGQISADHKNLKNITIYKFSSENRFIQRIDSQEAQIKNGKWFLSDTIISDSTHAPMTSPTFEWISNVDFAVIGNKFLSVDTLSFWQLPGFIKLIENAGLSSKQHRFYWNFMLARPFLLISMVGIAAVCTYHSIRRRSSAQVLVFGIFAAFGLYILHGIAKALGNSLLIPIEFAAWAPACISFFLTGAALLHIEE
jgi:lipopolysaccharide export system permease protein